MISCRWTISKRDKGWLVVFLGAMGPVLRVSGRSLLYQVMITESFRGIMANMIVVYDVDQYKMIF